MKLPYDLDQDASMGKFVLTVKGFDAEMQGQ